MFLIAGPCVIESEDLICETALQLQDITERLNIPFTFKSSFDKANRTSRDSFRGLGMERGLQILEKVKGYGIKVLTDVHEYTPLEEVREVVDVLQTPAFLCRQTDFLLNVARQGLPVNIKKGQWMHPHDMKYVVDKVYEINPDLMVCERGTVHGYGDLIVDMRSLVTLRENAVPVVFDATHSVQKMGGKTTGGNRGFVPTLARAAVAVGVDGLFMETHPEPSEALSDGPNMWPLHRMEDLLTELIEIEGATRWNLR